MAHQYARRNELRPMTILVGRGSSAPNPLNILANVGMMKISMNDVASTATESTTVHELADLMARHKINRIPIVRDEQLVGIVCRADLVRALARGKELQVEESGR